MSKPLATILIVDDEYSIRESLSRVLAEIGYWVRSAEDGFCALREIRHQTPDLLLSELNMPNMSGFELLSVMRRRFPATRTIAMSGSCSNDEAPSGFTADAFYDKAHSLGSLAKIIRELAIPARVRTPAHNSAALAPLWIRRNGSDAGKPYITISCPECLRTFNQRIDDSRSLIREARCVHCLTAVHYAIVEPVNRSSTQPAREAAREQRQLPRPQLLKPVMERI